MLMLNRAMPRRELARLKLMRQPMRSHVAQIVQPCEKSGLAARDAGVPLEERLLFPGRKNPASR